MNQRPIPPEKHGGSHQKSGSDPLRSQFLEVDHNALANQYPHHAPVPPGLVMGEEGEEGPMGMPGIQGPAGSGVVDGVLAITGLVTTKIPGVTFGIRRGKGLAHGRIFYMPFSVASEISITLLVLNVQTAATTGNARLGIYRAAKTWQPSSLVLDAGTVSIATTGRKTISVTQSLVPDRYLLALKTETSGATTPNLQAFVGFGGAGMHSEDDTGNSIMGYWVAQGSGALPDPGSAATGWDAGDGFEYIVVLVMTAV